MEIIQRQLVLYLLLFIYFLACTQAHSPASLNRTSFPTGFIFGAGSSAYQYEGAANENGRGPSIWDIFTRLQSDKIADRSNGDIADGFYYRYKEDIARVKEIGFDSFRFSISWSRILPKGKISGGVNRQGIDFYNNLIDELLSNGILPFVTLFHWDLPQALEDEYQGFLSPKIVNDYGDYVDLCFKEFGDRVKHWVTLNEPNLFSSSGYDTGTRAPGRCSNYIGNCMEGNSAIEPYIVTHHLILCHATGVRLYMDKYQASQKGTIGITVTTLWMVPKFQTVASKSAAARALDFSFGWIVHPIVYGDYPDSMRCLVGSRLPNFTKSESQMIKGSFDFISIDYYTANYAEDDSSSSHTVNLSYTTDSRVILSTEKNGIPIGQPTELSWLYIYPKGLQELMLYIKEKYQNPPIYITENGMADANNRSMSIKDALNDSLRIKYHSLHLWYLLKAMKDGVEVRGYYAWTFLDDFEWESGYTIRFGITYVDFINGMKRYFKHSAFWFKNFLQKKNVTTKPLLFYQ